MNEPSHQSQTKPRVAVITGGASGIGKACASVLGTQGISVVVADIDLSAARQTALSLQADGIDARAVRADVGDSDSVKSCLDHVLDVYNRVDILVNNAGLRLHQPALQTSDDAWDKTIQINLYSMFLCSTIFAPAIMETGGGSIVSISSIAAKAVFRRRPAYAAAKAGINALTRTFAVELADYGVRVNAVGPGQTRTELYDRWLAAGRLNVEADNARTPMNRSAQPSEIAEVVAFLTSEHASFVTGQTWYVDGGWTIAR